MKKYFIFPPHLTSASALPGEMQKHKNSARVRPVAGLIYSVLLLATYAHAAV